MVFKYLINRLVVFINEKEVEISSLEDNFVFPEGSYVYAVDDENAKSHDLVKKDISHRNFEGVTEGMSIRTFEGDTKEEFHYFYCSSSHAVK